jgi:hypothetical protein
VRRLLAPLAVDPGIRGGGSGPSGVNSTEHSLNVMERSPVRKTRQQLNNTFTQAFGRSKRVETRLGNERLACHTYSGIY